MDKPYYCKRCGCHLRLKRFLDHVERHHDEDRRKRDGENDG